MQVLISDKLAGGRPPKRPACAPAPSPNSGVAYLYTTESHTGVNYYDSQFVTTIDAIETRTGYDFFPNVPSSLQTSAESTATPLWTY